MKTTRRDIFKAIAGACVAPVAAKAGLRYAVVNVPPKSYSFMIERPNEQKAINSSMSRSWVSAFLNSLSIVACV